MRVDEADEDDAEDEHDEDVDEIELKWVRLDDETVDVILGDRFVVAAIGFAKLALELVGLLSLLDAFVILLFVSKRIDDGRFRLFVCCCFAFDASIWRLVGRLMTTLFSIWKSFILLIVNDLGKFVVVILNWLAETLLVDELIDCSNELSIVLLADWVDGELRLKLENACDGDGRREL